jgi:hypothetical protein
MRYERVLTLAQRLIGGLTIATALAAGAVILDAQSTNVNVGVLHQDIAQWGATSVSGAQALSDTLGNPTAPLLGASDLLWDTSQWVRHKAAALTTFPTATTTTARNIVGAAIMEKSSRWTVISNPAASSQATASIAAEASVRHVVDCVSFSAVAVVAPVLTALTINVRDGATGAGTVLWTFQVMSPAATGQAVVPHSICGLNLVGTTNTAMTLEFSALLTNLIESVSISGYNVT